MMYLYGASGHAKVIIEILEAMGCPATGLIDDNPDVSELNGYPVVHAIDPGIDSILISIGDNTVRRKIAGRLDGFSFATAVHPAAVVSPRAQIGEGSVVMQGAVIQSGAKIGRHCIVNTGATVDHDCTIGDYAHISPNATLCGNVCVGEGTQIGAGSVVVPGVEIGSWSLVCAGSVVTKNIPDLSVAAGNRCRVLRKMK